VTLLDYLADRLVLILGFALGTLFLLLVVHLSVARLGPGTAGYIVLLAGVFAVALLTLDYALQAPFRREVRLRLLRGGRAAARGGRSAPLPPGRTREQRALVRLVEDVTREGAEETQALRSAAAEHRAFLDLWVHQLKTPVTVLGLTAREGRHDPGAWDSVEEEVAELAHGLDLMLTSARLERFDLDLRPAAVDLTEVARRAVNELKGSWLRSGVFPGLVAPEAPVTVETDPKWLGFVLRQLLGNAIKYSEAGSRVGVVVDASGGSARLSVEDEGLGIPPEDLPRVFERYFTGANGRVRSASTGMGLYLAARVCAELGHRLAVESERGAGTTFTVTFATAGLFGG